MRSPSSLLSSSSHEDGASPAASLSLESQSDSESESLSLLDMRMVLSSSKPNGCRGRLTLAEISVTPLSLLQLLVSTLRMLEADALATLRFACDGDDDDDIEEADDDEPTLADAEIELTGSASSHAAMHAVSCSSCACEERRWSDSSMPQHRQNTASARGSDRRDAEAEPPVAEAAEAAEAAARYGDWDDE
jgi:hypothetical protein